MNYSLLSDQALVYYGNIAELLDVDLLHILSEKEINRAKKFQVESDQQRYIVSRAMLKRLLSCFLQSEEKEIELDYGKNGKPFLLENPELHFNISHSGNAFVIGFVKNREIGIDVENLNRNINISNLQTYLFTPSELELFQNIHPALKQEAFVNCWTRKEAILKATGYGLTQPMNELEVSFLKDKHFELKTKNEYLGNKEDWLLESFTLMGQFRGAVAVKGRIKKVQYIHINETNGHLNKSI